MAELTAQHETLIEELRRAAEDAMPACRAAYEAAHAKWREEHAKWLVTRPVPAAATQQPDPAADPEKDDDVIATEPGERASICANQYLRLMKIY